MIPAIQNAATHNPILAVLGGAFVGAGFGSLKPTDIGGEKVLGRYGKIVGGFLGASIMGAVVGYKMLNEAITGEAWIPQRREEERDTEEYFDVLKYIKYNKLASDYADLAKKEEGFDINSYVENEEKQGDFRKQKSGEIEKLKQRLYSANPKQAKDIIAEVNRMFKAGATDRESAMKVLNQELNKLTNYRDLKELSPISAKALLYKQQAKQTMYGYEAGDPIADVLAALPKKDRAYMVPFINAPEEERDRILDIVPDYMKRPLQSAWGLDVDQKESLQSFFKKHPLPGKDWQGWKENVDLNDIKVKYVDRVGLDPSEFDIWPDDQRKAAANPTPVPNIAGGRESAKSYASKIQDMFGKAGIPGATVEINEVDNGGKYDLKVNMNHNRSREINTLFNNEGYTIMNGG